MKKKYIIEVDESEIIEYWNEQGVKELGYQEYALRSCPNIKVKPYEERPQGDLISREALKEEIRQEVIENRVGVFVAKRIIKLIDNAPTVEPCYQTTSCLDCDNYDKENHNCPRYCEVIREAIKSRPKGEWIRYRDNPHQPEHIKCSNCGQYWSVADHDKTFDFCFKCGADMRGKEE